MNYTLITGASSGIGYEMAKIFGKNNHNLILVARDEGKMNSLKQELTSKYNIDIQIIVKDLTAENAIDEIYEETKLNEYNVEILVNNAGFGDQSAFLDSDYNKQENMIKLNILALMKLSYLYGNDMKKNKYERILNLSSVAAFMSGPYMSIYYASKAFVLSFSESMAEELKGTGVTVTCLCPGPTKTNFEKSANMKNSSMFTTFGGAVTPEAVAECGYKACMKGKHIQYHSLKTYLMNIGSRIFSRKFASKYVMKINKKG